MYENGTFVSWNQHGRSDALASAFGLTNVVMQSRWKNVVLRYASKIAQTISFMVRSRPDTVLFMQPPAPLLITVKVGALLAGTKTVVADLHSGYFNDKRWKWFSAFGLRIMRSDAVIVTNDNLAQRARALRAGSVYTLHDVLDKNFQDDPTTRVRNRKILVPLSYASDEPIAAILEAATLMPDRVFSLTGRVPVKIREEAPSNVEFTGFVSDHEFAEQMTSASAVLALTDRADTMQRAGYEALMCGTPLVTSDFPVLREFFEDGASYAEATAESIVAAIASVTSIPPSRCESILGMRMEEQRVTMDTLRYSLFRNGGC